MRQSRKKMWPRYTLYLGFLFLFFLGLTVRCSEKEEERELLPDRNTNNVMQKQQSEQKMTEILTIQNEIRLSPSDITIREKYLKSCVDKDNREIYAAGFGKPPETAKSVLIARQAAERAAYIDASRWIAYIIQWRKDIKKPDFGTIQGDIPGTKVHYKSISPDNEAFVLVKVDFP